MTKKKARKPSDRLTPLELKVVAYYQGDFLEACKLSGMSDPGGNGHRMLARPRVAKALAAKQTAAIAEMGRRTGKELAKADVSGRLLKLADIAHVETNGTITGQVNALKVLAEMEGWVIRKTEDVTKLTRGKTASEMGFFASHGYWPDSENVQSDESRANGPSRPGSGSDEPN